MESLKNSGLSSVSKKDVDDLKSQLKKEQKSLGRLIQLKKSQQTLRDKKKRLLQSICDKDESASKALKTVNRDQPGRARIEVDQPQLLSTILEIVEATSAADDRRRTQMIRTVKTLDDLTEELNSCGFNIKRTATYYRLAPKRSNSIAARNHVQTVPVRLLKAENSLRKKNIDRYFAKSFTDDMKALELLFGPDCTNYISADDKARILLGQPAANCQAPILMHIDYKVRLPDHNFVVGERHKLIPSVYGICNVLPNGKVSYSGNTFIRLRSGKHDSSTAYTHAYDLNKLFEDGSIPNKPILILETDGAADEAPKSPSTFTPD